MPSHLKIIDKRLEPAKRTNNSNTRALKEEEGRRIRKVLPNPAYTVAMDVKGKTFSTEDMAEKLAGWQLDGLDPVFLIGGPDGLEDELLGTAALRWSFGRITLPHALARVVWMEQIYRAWSILQNHPYHRA